MRAALLLALMSILGLLVGSVVVLSWTEGPISVSDAGNGLSLDAAATIADAAPTDASAAADSRLATPAAQVPVSTDIAGTLPTSSLASESRAAASPPARSSQPGLDPEQHLARIAFRREIASGLAALQQRVAPCDASDLTFTLELETVAGGIRVLDASVASGTAPEDKRASCATAAVRDHVIAAPNALPGQHWQITFSPHG